MADLGALPFGGAGLLEALQVNRQREQDAQQKQLFNQQMLEGALKLQADQLTLKSAQSDYQQQQLAIQRQAQAAAKINALTSDKGAAALSSQERLEQEADIYDQFGMVDQSGKLRTQASTLTDLQTKTAQLKEHALGTLYSTLDNQLSGVTDQTSYRLALQNMKAMVATGQIPGIDSRGAANIDQFINMPWQQGEKAIRGFVSSNLTAAQARSQQLDDQQKRAQANLQDANAEKARVDAQIEQYDLDIAKKHGIAASTRGSAGLNLSSDEQIVLGKLRNLNVNVPGGMSGAMLKTNVDAFMAATPRKPGESIDDYSTRVAEAALGGHATGTEVTSAARKTGGIAGATEYALQSIQGVGGKPGQAQLYLDTLKNLNLSRNALIRKGQTVEMAFAGTPEYDAARLQAYELARDYAVSSGRGGDNEFIDKQTADLMNVTSVAQGQTKVNQILASIRAQQRGTVAAGKSLGGASAATATQAPKVLTYDPATGTFK